MNRLLSMSAVLSGLMIAACSCAGETAHCVSQHGITWTFDKEYPVGRFINGDWWVVGPVTVTGISNDRHVHGFKPVVGEDGSMVNPGAATRQGYNKHLQSYDGSLNAAVPLLLPPHSSLVSTVSWLYTSKDNTEPGCPRFNRGTKTPRPTVRDAAVLTCLSAAPPPGSFRPAYCGNDKTIRFKKSDLQPDRLPNLPAVPNMPSPAELERKFERPWIDHAHEYLGAYVHPSENMPQYGRDLSILIGDASLLLMTDVPGKDELLVSFIQLGIDLAGIADAGGSWPSNGGHNMGRKWPILFAGVMLDDAHMKNVGQWSTGFQEDLDTFYVTDAEVAVTHHPSWRPDRRASRRAYEAHDIGLPEWGVRHMRIPAADNMAWDATYRHVNNPSYVGWVLAAHMMGQRKAWNHEPLFDYVDRATAVGNPGGKLPVFGSPFTESMWKTYRDDYPPRWVPDDPENVYSHGRQMP